MKLMMDVGMIEKPIDITKIKKTVLAPISLSLYFSITGYALVVIVNSKSVVLAAVRRIDSYMNYGKAAVASYDVVFKKLTTL